MFIKRNSNEEECLTCKENCLSECPITNGVKELELFNCRHCKPEKALCFKACKQNAINEKNSILSIDLKKCNNCGDCAIACSFNAIKILDNKALKCNQCIENAFKMPCLKKNCLKLSKTQSEENEINEIIGWALIENKFEKEKILTKSINCNLIKSQKEIFVELAGLNALSLEEARIIKQVTELFHSKQFKSNKKKFLEKKLFECIIELLKQKNLVVSRKQLKLIFKVTRLNAIGFGPISSLLKEPDYEEIALTGLGAKNPIRVFHKQFGWLKTNFYYSSEEKVKEIINKLTRKHGKRITLQKPWLNAVLNNGDRLHAALPPVAFSGPSITIRKFRQEPITPFDLIKNNNISSEALAFIWLAIQTDCNILIAGNTGSGKTTTLNSLFFFIPKNERIIAIEETPELKIIQEHKIKLNVIEYLDCKMQDLITDSLRMRPDRVVVGEVRNEAEVKAFINTILAGQGKGSYCTFHAQSTNELIQRLKALNALELDLTSIDLAIIQRRLTKINGRERTELRRIIEITELFNENNVLKANKLFEFDYKKDSLVKANESKKVKQKIMDCFNLNSKQINNEIKKRKCFLEKNSKTSVKFNEAFEQIQEAF